MEQQKKTGSEVKRRDNSRIWLVLILLLFFITLITSSLVGYILGSNAGPSSMGQLIDTILLTPESTDSRTMIHLSGIVAYTDGTPAAGRRLELHSDPITTVSDSKGGFLFPNVPQGEHIISILTDEGEVQVQRKINIQYDSRKEKDVSIQLTENGAYAIELSIDVRVLEVVIELDQESMRIDSESFTFSTRDGDVVTPTGSANVRDGVIVTPGGNVHLPDGNVVFPGGKTDDTAYIILSDDTVIEKQPIESGDIKVDADGAVSLPDGTVIEPGGKIIKQRIRENPALLLETELSVLSAAESLSSRKQKVKLEVIRLPHPPKNLGDRKHQTVFRKFQNLRKNLLRKIALVSQIRKNRRIQQNPLSRQTR